MQPIFSPHPAIAPKSGARFWIFLLGVTLLMSSCQKYLDVKPDDKLTTPATTDDLEQLLDNYYTINNSYPPLAEILADNYYLTSADWSAMTSPSDRNHYLWLKDDVDPTAYASPYYVILYANTVLDHLGEVEGPVATKERIRGGALLIRAAYYYGLLQLYAPPYEATTAGQALGLPLRLSADYNPPSVRATVQQNYDQVVRDLKEAAALLPVREGVKTRPTMPAAYGWLARTYLDMGQYDLALAYADSCLRLQGSLMDFNGLDAAASAPISPFNAEVVFHLRGYTAAPLDNAIAKVDSTLYASYGPDDLRKGVYFRSNGDGTYSFKGDYDGSGTASGYVFSGIVTDEMYLIRAECHARLGNTRSALEDLNTLLQTRWKKGTFLPFQANTPTEALDLILGERRKELLGRGTRWSDLRRLRLEPSRAVIPKRKIDGQRYELLPGSPRYTLLFPALVLEQTGMPQNP